MEDEFVAYTNEQLLDLESNLYEDETKGEDCWYFRDKVINEINRRGLWDD